MARNRCRRNWCLRTVRKIMIIKLLGLLRSPVRLVEAVSKLIVVYFIYLALTTLQSLSESGFTGGFELFSRGENGQIQVGKITAEKTVPAGKPDYIIGTEVNTKKETSVIVGKRVLSLGRTRDIFVTGKVQKRISSVEYSLGFILTF